MTKFTSSGKMFASMADACPDSLGQAYFGLVAIELMLKSAVGLRDHNVPPALNLFARKFAVERLAGCKIKINSLATMLQNDLAKITVQGKDGIACQCAIASYPNIRYTRLKADGWPDPFTDFDEIAKLASTVRQIRIYLREKFEKEL